MPPVYFWCQWADICTGIRSSKITSNIRKDFQKSDVVIKLRLCCFVEKYTKPLMLLLIVS